ADIRTSETRVAKLPVCQKAKMLAPHARKREGSSTVASEKFGGHVTVDHIINRDLRDVGVEGEKVALVAKDVCTNFRNVYPSSTKEAEQVYHRLLHFFRVGDEAKTAMDKEWQKLFDKSCWLHEKVREYRDVAAEAAKVIDVFGSQPGYAKQQADARQAYTQALFKAVETAGLKNGVVTRSAHPFAYVFDKKTAAPARGNPRKRLYIPTNRDAEKFADLSNVRFTDVDEGIVDWPVYLPSPRSKAGAKKEAKEQRFTGTDTICTESVPSMDKPVNVMIYDVKDFLISCVDRRRTYRRQSIASKVLMKIQFAARVARWDLLRVEVDPANHKVRYGGFAGGRSVANLQGLNVGLSDKFQVQFLEDNQATITIVSKGDSEKMRHTDRTQNISFGWLRQQLEVKHF
ncbi:unnamed protein product, partial [Symbiodinium necroappetens]